jgi:hypothetical protein
VAVVEIYLFGPFTCPSWFLLDSTDKQLDQVFIKDFCKTTKKNPLSILCLVKIKTVQYSASYKFIPSLKTITMRVSLTTVMALAAATLITANPVEISTRGEASTAAAAYGPNNGINPSVYYDCQSNEVVNCKSPNPFPLKN